MKREVFRDHFGECLEHRPRNSTGIEVRLHAANDQSGKPLEGHLTFFGLRQLEGARCTGSIPEVPVEHPVHAGLNLRGQLLQLPTELVGLGHAVAVHRIRQHGVHDVGPHRAGIDAPGRDLRSLSDARASVPVDGHREYSIFVL